MPIPTLGNVLSLSRILTGDTQVPGGQVYTDLFLMNFYPTSYRSMVRVLAQYNNKRMQRTSYYNLPAYTGYLLPASAAITNFGEPIDLFERSIDSSALIEAISYDADRVLVTIAGHPYTTGQMAIVFGVRGLTDDVNDEWCMECPDANSIYLQGCRATGTYTLGSGTLSHSTEGFPKVPLVREFDTQASPSIGTNSLDRFRWEGDAFRFNPISIPRQLKIVHTISGNPPTTAANLDVSTGVDDCLDFLAYYTAAAALAIKGPSESARLFTLACGYPDGVFTGPGRFPAGQLGGLIAAGVKSSQMERIIPPRFRPRRNTGLFNRY